MDAYSRRRFLPTLESAPTTISSATGRSWSKIDARRSLGALVRQQMERLMTIARRILASVLAQRAAIGPS